MTFNDFIEVALFFVVCSLAISILIWVEADCDGGIAILGGCFLGLLLCVVVAICVRSIDEQKLKEYQEKYVLLAHCVQNDKDAMRNLELVKAVSDYNVTVINHQESVNSFFISDEWLDIPIIYFEG